MTVRSALATVIVPTHEHHSTLDLAVESVLAQSIQAIEVVVIGDGADDATRAVATDLARQDRVRFLDTPKSPSRAEEARHRVLTEVETPFVCYLGDDDLMLRDHLATMIELLDGADFAHPVPVMVAADGTLAAHPTDIARPECRQWHQHPGRNCISLSGVAHRLDAYRALPVGWRHTPPGAWSDHYMWQQWFATPGLRFVTGDRLTVLKFDASLRRTHSAEERRTELLAWRERSAGPGFAMELGHMVADAHRRAAVDLRLDLGRAEDAASSQAETAHADQRALAARAAEAESAAARLEAELVEVTARWRVAAADRSSAQERARSLELELGEASAGSERLRAERDDAASALVELESTRTWRAHRWLERRGLLSLLPARRSPRRPSAD